MVTSLTRVACQVGGSKVLEMLSDLVRRANLRNGLMCRIASLFPDKEPWRRWLHITRAPGRLWGHIFPIFRGGFRVLIAQIDQVFFLLRRGPSTMRPLGTRDFGAGFKRLIALWTSMKTSDSSIISLQAC
jgi:hypothetical protein